MSNQESERLRENERLIRACNKHAEDLVKSYLKLKEMHNSSMPGIIMVRNNDEFLDWIKTTLETFETGKV